MVWLGFILILMGVILPFLMVIQLLPSTFLLNFFAYILGLIGLFISLIGISNYVRRNRGK
jgi:hypothetical protein